MITCWTHNLYQIKMREWFMPTICRRVLEWFCTKIWVLCCYYCLEKENHKAPREMLHIPHNDTIPHHGEKLSLLNSRDKEGIAALYILLWRNCWNNSLMLSLSYVLSVPHSPWEQIFTSVLGTVTPRMKWWSSSTHAQNCTFYRFEFWHQNLWNVYCIVIWF